MHRSDVERGPRALGLALLVATSVWGCAAVSLQEDLPVSLRTARDFRKEELTVVRETPHLVFRHAPWHGIAERDLALAEEFLVETARRLGVSPPAKTLYLIVDDDWMRDRVGHRRHAEAIPRPGLARVEGFGEHPADRVASALREVDAGSERDVAYDAIVLSSSPANLHELTHVACGELLSPEDYAYRSPLLFEGLAVAWDGRSAEQSERRLAALYRESGALLPSDLVMGFPTATEDPRRLDLAYEVSGSFVRYLLARHGLEDVVALLCAARKDRFYDTFEQILEQSFEDAESGWAGAFGSGVGDDT